MLRIEINIHEKLCVKLVIHKDHTRMHGQQNIDGGLKYYIKLYSSN